MKPLNIFVAEDNDADVLLIREALRIHGIAHHFHLFEDGADALEAVHKMGDAAHPYPDLFLLDINIGKADGLDILAAVRRQPHGLRTPVIIVTSSGAPRDRARAQALGASYYFQKPYDLDSFLQLGAVVREVIAASPPLASGAAS